MREQRLRIAAAIFSYLDTISFGVTADYDAVPDLEVLIDGIGRGRTELDGVPAAEMPPPVVLRAVRSIRRAH